VGTGGAGERWGGGGGGNSTFGFGCRGAKKHRKSFSRSQERKTKTIGKRDLAGELYSFLGSKRKTTFNGCHKQNDRLTATTLKGRNLTNGSTLGSQRAKRSPHLSEKEEKGGEGHTYGTTFEKKRGGGTLLIHTDTKKRKLMDGKWIYSLPLEKVEEG